MVHNLLGTHTLLLLRVQLLLQQLDLLEQQQLLPDQLQLQLGRLLPRELLLLLLDQPQLEQLVQLLVTQLVLRVLLPVELGAFFWPPGPFLQDC